MPLTPWEILTFLPKTGLLVSSLAATALTSPIRGSDQPKTLGEHIQRAAFRAAFDSFTVGQLQTVLPSTEAVYLAENKKAGQKPVIVDKIPNTTIKAFWIGDHTSASVYLVYYHGGGFVLPAVDGHVQLLHRIVKWSDGKIAILLVDYTLSPPARYPQPIQESVEALKYAADLAKTGNKELAIAGDSAGGNLVLAVLSILAGHALKVGDEQVIAAPLDLATPLKSALAIAPWVSSDHKKFKSLVASSHRDIITFKSLDYWSAVYKGADAAGTGTAAAGAKDGEFIVPEETEPAWWEPVKGKVGSVLVVAGDHEILRDPIVSWYATFEKGFGTENTRLLVAKNEVHDAPGVPKPEAEVDALGDAETQEGAVKRWAQALVK